MPPSKSNRGADSPFSIDELLQKGKGQGGPAAEALRRAARVYREKGDLVTAAQIFEEACEKATVGPIDKQLHAELELELGGLYEKDLGRLDQAMDRYERAFKLDPDNAQAIDAGRRVYRALGDWVQVARLYEVELEASSPSSSPSGDPHKRAELLLQLGLIRGKKVGDLVGAAVRLEEAVRLRGDQVEAKQALAELYVSPDFPMPPGDTVGPPERAAQLFLELAATRQRAGDRDGEIGFLKRALGADPYHVDAAVRLEKAYADLSRTDELRHLYRLDAPVPRRNVKRALFAARAGDLDEAMSAAIDANAEGDDASEAVAMVEAAFVQKNDFAAVASFKEKLLEAAPAADGTLKAERLLEIAALLERANAPARQEAALRAALEADPGHPDVFKLLVGHLVAKRNYGSVVQLSEAAVEAAPIEEQPLKLAELAELYEKRIGDAGAAVSAWQRAEAIVPSQKGAAELKRLRQKQERWGSVIQAIDRELAAAPVGPARADVLKRMAQVKREQHDLRRSKQLLEEALELKPDDATLYRALADLHEHHGDVEGVAKTLRRQLKASREKVEKLNLLRRLAQTYDERLDDSDGVIWASEEILGFLPGDRDALKRLESAYEKSGADGQEPLVEVLEKHAQAAATPAERIPVLHKLAAIYEQRGQGETVQAADRLEKILKLDKSDQKAQDAIARLYEKLERWADAALALDRVLGRVNAPVGSAGADAWKRFARIVDGKLGDPVRAVRAWKEVLERRPTDREALEAVSRLARARGDIALLDDVLRRRQEHAEGAEAAAIALERATMLAERDPGAAAKMLRTVLDDLDPRNLEAHARLRKLEHAAGNLDISLRVAERELFLNSDPARKLELALEIARSWRDEVKDARRALSSFERVIDLDPNHAEALTALGALYGGDGDWERQVVINEHRLGLAVEAGDFKLAVQLNFELAMTAEERLHDPQKAFEYFRRAHDLEQSDGTLGELRRVAELYGLWEEMCVVYATMKGLEPRLRVSEIADEKLQDPKRAFAVLRSSLGLDPQGERLLPELERLSVRAEDPAALLEVYEALIARRTTNAERIALLRKRAAVREERQKSPSGAMDELLRAFRIDPDDAQLLREIRRLAETTGRWEDALGVEGFRFHRAEGKQKLEIALEAATLVEEKVKDKLRAFRAYLRAFQLAPGEPSIRKDLWRLAREIPIIDEKVIPPAPSSPGDRPHDLPPLPRPSPGGATPMKMREREPTLEINLNEMIFDESGAIRLDSGAVKLDAPPERRRDPTVELSLNDLMPMLRKPPASPPKTVELSISDVVPGHRSAPPPPHLTATRTPALKAEVPRQTHHALLGPHSAWDELAVVLLGQPAEDAPARFAHLVAVSEMWEKGAGDLDKAFEALASAFRLDPDSVDARGALERLAESNDAWDRLVAVFDATIEETGSAERAVRLIVDSAEVREKQGQLADAEERYHRALGMRPDWTPALERLEAIYRQAGRKQDLASLLERRLSGLLERMPPGEPRRLRAIELATVYESLGNTYEAIDAWKRVADENQDQADAFARLAELYESVAQWSKVVESLTRELDVLDQGQGRGKKGDRERARERRRRIGQIYEKELELPDRAIEAYGALHDFDEEDADAEAALERLYEKLGRHAELEALLAARCKREKDPERRAELLERRARILSERLKSPEASVDVLRQLRKLRPDDTKVGLRLEEALSQAGRAGEQAEALQQRIAAAQKRGALPDERARLLVELARLQAGLGEGDEAQRTLERALDLKPSDPNALAELARLRHGGSDWDGYAAAREREAEVAPTPEHAAEVLVDAARVHIEKRKDDPAARRALERALEKDPRAASAMAELGKVLRRIGDDETADDLARRELALTGERAVPVVRQAELHAALGGSLLRRGELDEAGRAFREAMAAHPAFPAAVEGLADVAARTGAWDEVEALLRNAAARDGVKPSVAAQFHRRLADAAERQGRGDDAYTSLLEADRLLPSDLQTRLLLGENRYKMNRFREAAQYLGALVDHPELKSRPDEAGEALYHGALAELKLRRPERALPLLERAVEVKPHYAEALGLLAERMLEGNNLERAVALLERQAAATDGEDERAVRYERVADVILSELKDDGRACAAFERALEAAGKWASSQLLEKTLRMERQVGQLERAAVTAARLLEKEAPPPVRARRLREAASLDAALGKTAEAKDRLRKALELDPLDQETLAGLSAMLVTEGADQDAATLLTRSLPLLPSPGADLPSRTGRATLWMRLGECRERLRDGRGATLAFERALEADPSRRPLREQLLERYGDDAAHDEVVRTHRMVLLADDPLHVPSLRAMARLEGRANARDGGRRFLELLAVAGAISDEERRLLSATASPEDRDQRERGDGGLRGALDEGDHELLAHAEAITLAPVFASLWEGTAGERAPDLASFGVRNEDRVSPVAANDLARAYSTCSLALGNRKTGLYMKADPAFTGLALVARPPTAIIVGPQFAEGRALPDVRFLLGRALEIARPEYILAAALPRDEFTKLFAGILRAFHPRHARRSRDDEAAMWKRALPYKVAKRLAELFAERADTQFSSVRWRRAVQHTGNRAGLVASGDVIAAARVLVAENDQEGLRELARFAASDDYVALRIKLTRA